MESHKNTDVHVPACQNNYFNLNQDIVHNIPLIRLKSFKKIKKPNFFALITVSHLQGKKDRSLCAYSILLLYALGDFWWGQFCYLRISLNKQVHSYVAEISPS